MDLQRLPTRSMQTTAVEREAEPTALIRLARQIREQQGAEQTRAFFLAMTPFVAPGELKHAASLFGIDLTPPAALSQNVPKAQSSGMDPMMLMAALMQMKGGSQNGVDPMRLIELMRGK